MIGSLFPFAFSREVSGEQLRAVFYSFLPLEAGAGRRNQARGERGAAGGVFVPFEDQDLSARIPSCKKPLSGRMNLRR